MIRQQTKQARTGSGKQKRNVGQGLGTGQAQERLFREAICQLHLFSKHIQEYKIRHVLM